MRNWTLGLSAWDLLLLVGASFVAVTSLVRMMRAHRDELVTRLDREAHAEQLRRRAEELKQQQAAQTAA
jgi:hypothetical protein